MMHAIPEPDWKIFRELHPIALERFCERVLAEVAQVTSSTADQSAHERYLALFQLMKDRNKELARAFDDFRRSTARQQLAVIRAMGLLTDQELARFSPETRAAVQAWLGE